MATELKVAPEELIEDYRHGFHDPEDKYAFKSAKGLTREIVERISSMKAEPAWMLAFRLKALRAFPFASPCRTWGDTARLNEIDFDDIHYFVKASEGQRAVVGRRPRRHQADLRPARASPKPSGSS